MATDINPDLCILILDFTTVNLDMIQHYRPRKNVLERPVQLGYALTGHHEIMLPLLRAEALRRLRALET